MKYIKILPMLLCVFCLTGCQESGNADKTEETDLQEAYASQEESQAELQLNKEEENTEDKNSEEADSIEKIKKYMIPEQSFDVSLDDWGEVKFVSCEPSPDEWFDEFKVASFYLIKDDRILYKFPYRFENNSSRGYRGLFESVGAVAFRDLNDDKKDDIIIISYFLLGAGPTGMIPRPGVTIYLAGENEFYVAEDLIAVVEDPVLEKHATIESICDALQHKKQ